MILGKYSCIVLVLVHCDMCVSVYCIYKFADDLHLFKYIKYNNKRSVKGKTYIFP